MRRLMNLVGLAWLGATGPAMAADWAACFDWQRDPAAAIVACDLVMVEINLYGSAWWRDRPSAQAGAYYSRGSAHLMLRQLNEALSDLDQSIRADGGSSAAFNNRGLVHEAQGDLPAASADFQQAARLDPEDDLSRGNLARVSARTVSRQKFDNSIGRLLVRCFGGGQFTDIIDACDAVIARSGEVTRTQLAGAHYHRGVILFRQGESAKAVPDLITATELAPDDAEFARALAEARS